MEENKDFKEINEILEMYSEDKSKARLLFAKFNKENSCENFLEIEREKEINRTNILEFVEKFVREQGIKLDDIKLGKNRHIRNKLIKILFEKSSLSKREIANILRINRETIRILSKEPSL